MQGKIFLAGTFSVFKTLFSFMSVAKHELEQRKNFILFMSESLKQHANSLTEPSTR